jgi:CheY-like chemotaxis protein
MALVVVAEDDGDVRQVPVRILRRAGHTTIPTADGSQAWAAVREHDPDAVVSDIDMPVMSGVDLCLAIRAHPPTQHLPVVLVSGSLVPGDDRPARAEATAFIRKPYLEAELTASLDKALETGHEPDQAPSGT